ncbi:hypothetical protein L5L55_17480 [Shewanella glacialipiscicola]|uniref:hypothetical protein n=1 Tax=Shewanella glacialipiscicola TaxID=614069 RepID=UPI0021D99BE5|nr:hypothetical protein [Shewanella glacialipiscicola]MCU7996659.1 hypothetical protein [Shewanella glacialipiscicola]MCU8027972.1 hypothetical protein [Shewanella glacialipiscicola]
MAQSSVDKIKNTKSFTATDAHSEIMIFHKQMSEICRLELEPETLMIFSTDADDR